MVWIEDKSVGLGRPHFADAFEGRESLEGLQPPPIIIGVKEAVEESGQLHATVVMVAFDSGFRLVLNKEFAQSPGKNDQSRDF